MGCRSLLPSRFSRFHVRAFVPASDTIFGGYEQRDDVRMRSLHELFLSVSVPFVRRSRGLVVVRPSRSWVRAVFGRVMVRFLGLFPWFLGFLLARLYVVLPALFALFHDRMLLVGAPMVTNRARYISASATGFEVPSSDAYLTD